MWSHDYVSRLCREYASIITLWLRRIITSLLKRVLLLPIFNLSVSQTWIWGKSIPFHTTWASRYKCNPRLGGFNRPPMASSSMSFTTLVDIHVLLAVSVDPAHPAIWVVAFLLKLVCAEKCSLKLRLSTEQLLDFLISDFISNRRCRFDRLSIVSISLVAHKSF